MNAPQTICVKFDADGDIDGAYNSRNEILENVDSDLYPIEFYEYRLVKKIKFDLKKTLIEVK